jgi:hypothetical protein
MIHRVMAAAGRELYHVGRGSTTTHRRLRERLTVIAVATVGVDLICAVLVLFRSETPTKHRSRRSAAPCSGPARSS